MTPFSASAISHIGAQTHAVGVDNPRSRVASVPGAAKSKAFLVVRWTRIILKRITRYHF